MFNGKFPTRDTFCKMPQRDQLRIEKVYFRHARYFSHRIIKSRVNLNARGVAKRKDR